MTRPDLGRTANDHLDDAPFQRILTLPKNERLGNG
jgi:hypothetical protein